MPPADAVRVEELINYFPYDYPDPRGERPVLGHHRADAGALGAATIASCSSACRAGASRPRELPPSNLVFLLDVSGSMASPDKLPLVQARLPPAGRAAAPAGSRGHRRVRRRGGARAAVARPASDKQRHPRGARPPGGRRLHRGRRGHQARLRRGARATACPSGNNRVILATDGDFNVGVSSEGELVRLIERTQAARASSSPCSASAPATSRTAAWRRSPTRATATTPTSTTSSRRGRCSCRSWAPRW